MNVKVNFYSFFTYTHKWGTGVMLFSYFRQIWRQANCNYINMMIISRYRFYYSSLTGKFSFFQLQTQQFIIKSLYSCKIIIRYFPRSRLMLTLPENNFKAKKLFEYPKGCVVIIPVEKPWSIIKWGVYVNGKYMQDGV